MFCCCLSLCFFKVPPAVHQIQNKTIAEGGAVNLTCNASGTPPLMVSWLKPDGQRVDASELMLTNINRSEAGEYRCEASNECGNASQTATINVQCKLTIHACCWFSFLPEGFSPGSPVFLPPQKPTLQIPIRSWMHVHVFRSS